LGSFFRQDHAVTYRPPGLSKIWAQNPIPQLNNHPDKKTQKNTKRYSKKALKNPNKPNKNDEKPIKNPRKNLQKPSKTNAKLQKTSEKNFQKPKNPLKNP
jgi:hypothetical protein